MAFGGGIRVLWTLFLVFLCFYSIKELKKVNAIFLSPKVLVYRALLLWVDEITVKILKFGTPQTIAIIVLKIEKFGVTLH